MAIDNERFKVMYENMSPIQMEIIVQLRTKANELSAILDKMKPTRELSLAFTNLEQGMMWAIKNVCQAEELK